MVNRGEAGYLREFGVQTHFVRTLDDVNDFKRWLGQQRAGDVLGCDTECEGLQPEKSRVRLVQFGDLHDGWALPWDDWRGVIREVFATYNDTDYVFHNSKYDAREIQQWSDIRVPWARMHDTMTMAHLVDPQRPKGLKPLAARLVDPEAVASQRIMHDAMNNNHWDWKTIPIDFQWYWVYAALDPVLTCHIYQDLAPAVFSRYSKPYEIERGATRCLAEMEATGMRVDLDYSRQQYDKLTGFAQQGRQWLKDNCGIDGMSSQQMIKYFQAQGVAIPDKQTASGAQAMDKEVLEGLHHPVADLILKIKRAEKLAEPYFANFLRDADNNSRVHPNVWSMGARTGRMSITDPALQTLPKRDTLVRSAFIPDEGNALVSVDYHQVEARLMAHFSGDKGLQGAFSEGDFFCNLATGAYGHKVEKHDMERKLIKTFMYGTMYGAGVAKLSKSAQIPEAQMQEVSDKMAAQYPGIRAFQKKIEAVGMARLNAEGEAYVLTPTGRRLVADPDKVYTLTNYLIQGHAAELLKTAMVRVKTMCDQQYGPGVVKMLVPIHDEVVSECPKAIAPEVTKTIEDAMAYHQYTPNLLAEGEWNADNWGALTEE
jgi:DNA polymerase-1